MSSSLSYHNHLMEFLSDPPLAAAYLEDILQDNEGEPRLLDLALNQVAEALGTSRLSPIELKAHKQQLELLLQYQGSDVINELEQWLKVLGLKLSITSLEINSENQKNLSKLNQNLTEKTPIYSS